MVSLSLLASSLLVLLFAPLSSSLNSDGFSLLALKAAAGDLDRAFDTWSDSDQTPCRWNGVTCTRRRVTGLNLSRRGLSGYIPSELGAVVTLRWLTLSFNNFSKPIPSRLFNATALIHLDLSHNSLSGPVPPEIKALKNLTHLDLSSNLLNGSLPEGLSELNGLVGTLNLSYNRFSGEVPASYGNFPVLLSLDFQQNNLTGEIPQVGSLLNQGPTAFAGNPYLCGFPLGTPCPGSQKPNLPGEPQNPNVPAAHSEDYRGRDRRGAVTVILISGASVALVVVSVFVWLVRKKRWVLEGKTGKRKPAKQGHDGNDEGQSGRFRVVDEGFGLELEDLLRASAYVVGKSKGGIVYKVVAGRGSAAPPAPPQILAVRRLSEGDGGSWRFKEFEAEVDAIARVRHPNIVRLRAYYYAHDEKLLVSDFIPNGSLFAALHGGGPSSNSPPLPWAARLKIARGVARALTHIHECSPRKYVHGNMKSSKILLDDDLQAHVSGFGLARLVLAASKLTNSSSRKQASTQTGATASRIPASSVPYAAPEARSPGAKFTQRCEVYSFGVVLLELLTGRLPEDDEGELDGAVRRAFEEERAVAEVIDPALLPEAQARPQVVAAFRVALDCTELDPELRPRMRAVSECLDGIKLQ